MEVFAIYSSFIWLRWHYVMEVVTELSQQENYLTCMFIVELNDKHEKVD